MHGNWQVRWKVSGVLFWWSYFLCEVGDYDLKIQIEEEGGGRVRDFMEVKINGILNTEACNRVKASQWLTRHGRMLGSQNDTKMSTEDPVWTENREFVMPLILKFLQFFYFTPCRFTQHSLYNSWEFRQFEFSKIVIIANWVQWKDKESTNRCICEKSFIEIKEKKAVIREE